MLSTQLKTFLLEILQIHELVRTDNSRFSDKYSFEKPNDRRALHLMNAAAKAVMTDLPDVVMAYGVSDEYRYSLLWGATPGKLLR